jgi:hypothetical protein
MQRRPPDGAGTSSSGAGTTAVQRELPAVPATGDPRTVTGAAADAASSPALSISPLLVFCDARIEAAYQHYMYKVQQAADACLILISLAAVAVAAIKQHTMPPPTTASSLRTSLLCMLSGGQSLALLAMLLGAPPSYARHRGLLVCAARLYRLAVWLLYLRDAVPPRLFQRNLALRLLLLSPAGGNIWLALFYPLPPLQHIVLLALSAFVATWRSNALSTQLAGLGVREEQLTAAHQQLGRFSRHVLCVRCACVCLRCACAALDIPAPCLLAVLLPDLHPAAVAMLPPHSLPRPSGCLRCPVAG